MRLIVLRLRIYATKHECSADLNQMNKFPYPFSIVFWPDKRVSVAFISLPPKPPEIILGNKPVGRISNHVYHCWLTETMLGKIEDEMMFEKEKWFLKHFINIFYSRK